MDPTSKDQDRPARDKQGRRLWVRDAWQWILGDALGEAEPMPAWSEAYALTRFSVSKPATVSWFNGYDEKQPSRAEWIGPGGFGVLGHVHPRFADRTQALPAAPYESDPANWPQLDWYDRRTAQPTRVLTSADRNDPERFATAVLAGTPVLATLGGVVARYRDRTEHKSRSPAGQRTESGTAGLLQRRPVTAAPETTELIGKEGNQLGERLLGEALAVGQYRNAYGSRLERWESLVQPILMEVGAVAIAAATGASMSAVYRVLEGSLPHRRKRPRYVELAVAHARQRLGDWGIDPPYDTAALLWSYLHEREALGENVRRCEWCGQPLEPGARSNKRYHDECRQPAYRAQLGGDS